MGFSLIAHNSTVSTRLMHGVLKQASFVHLRRAYSKKADSENIAESTNSSSDNQMHSSLNKHDNRNLLQTKQAKAPVKRKSSLPSQQELSSRFLSTSQLPKPPQEVLRLSHEQLCAKIDMKAPPKPIKIDPPFTYVYKFEIPPKFIDHQHGDWFPIDDEKADLGNDKPTSPFIPVTTFLEERDEQGKSITPSHPLKESITGLFVSNPIMYDIDNDFLRSEFPKPFGNAPFGGDPSFDGFRKFEDRKTAKIQAQKNELEEKAQKLNEIDEAFEKSRSFFRKPSQQLDKSSRSSTNRGGRKKLDRNLLEQYRKYKKNDGKDDEQ